MHGYVALYRNKRAEVFADTSYEAQQKAAAIFKARRAWEVSVYLVEQNGETVTNSTASI
jgi:hypothetical protein